MKKILSILLVIVLMTSVFAGCGKKEETPASAPAPAQTPAQTTAPAETKPAEQKPAEPQYKEDMVIGIHYKFSKIDPQETNTAPHCSIFRTIYDTLIQYNNTEKKLEPRLATEWKTDDGINYAFTLRDDVYFHNGEKLTAEDVKFTVERGRDFSAAGSLFKSIESIEVVDDTHFNMKLSSVNVDILYQLTLPGAFIINKKALEDDPEFGMTIGTGAYTLDSYEFGNYTLVKRNENYWGEAPKTKSLKFWFISEDSARLIALETGEIDVCLNPDTNELKHITDNKDLELKQFDLSSINYLALNNEKGLLSNSNLRLALCHGIDRDEIIDVVFNGLAVKSESYWAYSAFGYNGGGVTNYDYNPEKAKEYLAKEGYNESNPMTVHIGVIAGQRKAMGELAQNQLKASGVNVVLDEYDSAGVTALTTTDDERYEACFLSCSPNVFGDDMTRFIDDYSAGNRLHLHDPLVHELMDKARQEMDEAKRKEMYSQVQQRMYEIGAVLPICTPYGFVATHKGVEGIDFYPTSHHDFSQMYLQTN